MGSWRFFFWGESLVFEFVVCGAWLSLVSRHVCEVTHQVFRDLFREEGGVQFFWGRVRPRPHTQRHLPGGSLGGAGARFSFRGLCFSVRVDTLTPFRHRPPPSRWFSRTDRSEERPVHQGTQTLCEFLLAALGQQTGAVHRDASGKDTLTLLRFGCKIVTAKVATIRGLRPRTSLSSWLARRNQYGRRIPGLWCRIFSLVWPLRWRRVCGQRNPRRRRARKRPDHEWL